MRRANFVGTKFSGGGKRGRAKIPSPQPPSFLPARASGFVPAARSAAISRDFVQKRFERRSVIATALGKFSANENYLPVVPKPPRDLLPSWIVSSHSARLIGIKVPWAIRSPRSMITGSLVKL